MNVAWIVFLFVLGACVGSFLNVVIYRLPRGQSIVFPPSHCPRCGRKIRWYDNVPILSYIRLRGRCRFCNARISPRYLLIELATASLLSGLYVCYYGLGLRNGTGPFDQSWPMFVAHATLLCGLLACSVVDTEHWIVPLEVCWFVSLVGVAAATVGPHPFWPAVSPMTAAMSLAAVPGLGVALALKRAGLIRESFIDADDKLAARRTNRQSGQSGRTPPKSVAFSAAHGVNPRKEILLEVVFLAPAFALAGGAWLVLTYLPSARRVWFSLVDPSSGGRFAAHAAGFSAALFGYLVGGLWIWGMRIVGTLAFGKEAMGLGDVHILAAVGAATGWIIPSVAFFVAPIFGLLWAIYLWLGRNQRELPYGPWLAAATLVVMIFYDAFAALLAPFGRAVTTLAQ